MNLRLYEKTCHMFLLAYLQSPESLQAYDLKVNLQKAPCTIKASYIRKASYSVSHAYRAIYRIKTYLYL